VIRLLIAGGGTGGHLYPGIAVARELLAQVPGTVVSFVGTANGIEARVVPREGFELDVIRSAGLKGKSLQSAIRGVALLPFSALDAWRVLSRRRPSVVVGVGGYSSGPVMALASARRIPTLLMEQNAVPGLTNRVLARIADAAAVTYEESIPFFGGKAFVAGNPVRPEFFESVPDQSEHVEGYDRNAAPPEAARVLVFGGSQGAHAINVAMVEAAPRLAAATPRLEITHQTGERDLEMVRDGYGRAGVQARVEPFLFAMDREMKLSDVVVSRAGATTLAELMAAGKPALLVPLPTATDDHQRKNAEALVRQGAARMLDQRELTGERLAAELLEFARDPALRAAIGERARALARPDAARLIAAKVRELAGGADSLPRTRSGR
jgi:UDP-N-acetylglucosamine--N-acetylmuramyl-(pentapeptide) pyrophosphoryl-undecaprenol N-acetylglucosamine transferase